MNTILNGLFGTSVKPLPVGQPISDPINFFTGVKTIIAPKTSQPPKAIILPVYHQPLDSQLV